MSFFRILEYEGGGFSFLVESPENRLPKILKRTKKVQIVTRDTRKVIKADKKNNTTHVFSTIKSISRIKDLQILEVLWDCCNKK